MSNETPLPWIAHDVYISQGIRQTESGEFETYKLEPVDAVSITGHDGRTIFRIKADGTVEGEVADASEAAEIFCRDVERMMRAMTTAHTF